MGASVTLLQKDWLVLSLEADRTISLEMSTGFTGRVSSRTGTSVDLSVAELGEIISELTKIHGQLLLAKTCVECGLIVPSEELVCANCESVMFGPMEG